MIARILPPEEWPRLVGTEAEHLWPHIKPENARVLVVEEDGAIVATWTLLRVVHAECLWADPKHRGFGVTKRLLGLMREVATEWGAPGKVFTGSISPDVTDLIERFGGEPMPCETFILPLDGAGRQRVRDRLVGRSFHRQVAELIADEPHPDDMHHDEAVGRALRTAIKQHAPERAEREYNEWAGSAGYEPVRFLGIVGDRLRADIKTAVIEVDAAYAVRVAAHGEIEACRQWELRSLQLWAGSSRRRVRAMRTRGR